MSNERLAEIEAELELDGELGRSMAHELLAEVERLQKNVTRLIEAGERLKLFAEPTFNRGRPLVPRFACPVSMASDSWDAAVKEVTVKSE